MRKLLITLDDELDGWLSGKPNQNEVVREALRLYEGKINVDTIAGLRRSYLTLFKFMETRFERYDEYFERMDKLIEHIETRMQ